MNFEKINNLIICIPIYNDWDSIFQLISSIDEVFIPRNDKIEILLIDDGSSKSHPKSLGYTLNNISRVTIVTLCQNMGHQRALAIGLSFIHDQREPDAVIIMDGDGEDPPKGIIQLIETYMKDSKNSIVFAQRVRRMEGFLFQNFYRLYRTIFYCLTGHSIKFGNFSILSKKYLARLVYVSELWNHYAASVIKARFPYVLLPINRAPRISGDSKMNFPDLVTLGLSAIAVFADKVTVRLMVVTAGFSLITLLGIAFIIFIRIKTSLAIPGWASYMTSIFMLSLFQIVIILLVLVIINLHSRSNSPFLPARDFIHFVSKVVSLDIK